MTTSLDFVGLDGLAFAAQRGRLTGGIPDLVARDLGPLIELHLLAAAGLLTPPEKADWLDLGGLAVLFNAIAGGRRWWVCPDGQRIGFLRSHIQPQCENAWTSFRLAAQQAATAVGFPNRIAQQFAAALGELNSNIYEHSGASGTGIIAFRAIPNRFEFVVADRGVGVLRSLQASAGYADLADHGEALRLAITEGVSRFGPNSGRGYGFRPIFVGLSNLNGSLRFRSGDHAILIDGRNPSLMTSRSAQKAFLPGLFVSIACNTDGS